MSHFDALKIAKNEIGISKYVPITHLLEATIFEASNTMVGSVIKLSGIPFDTEKDEVLNNYKRTWHRALTALSEQFCVYITTHRHKEDIDLSGEFSNDFAREIDREYHQQFKHNAMYVNDIYLTVIYKGITTGKVGKSLSFINKLTNKAIKSARDNQRRQQVKALKKAVNQLMTSLSVFGPSLLGSRDELLGYSELLSFFGIILNAGEYIKFNAARYAAPTNRSFEQSQKAQDLYPYGNIANYIANKRIFFWGKYPISGLYQK